MIRNDLQDLISVGFHGKLWFGDPPLQRNATPKLSKGTQNFKSRDQYLLPTRVPEPSVAPDATWNAQGPILILVDRCWYPQASFFIVFQSVWVPACILVKPRGTKQTTLQRSLQWNLLWIIPHSCLQRLPRRLSRSLRRSLSWNLPWSLTENWQGTHKN